jgi:hypothetical protein
MTVLIHADTSNTAASLRRRLKGASIYRSGLSDWLARSWAFFIQQLLFRDFFDPARKKQPSLGGGVTRLPASANTFSKLSCSGLRRQRRGESLVYG